MGRGLYKTPALVAVSVVTVRDAKAVMAAVPVPAILTAVTIAAVPTSLSLTHHTFVTITLLLNLNKHGDAARVNIPPSAFMVVEHPLNVMYGIVSSSYTPALNSGHKLEKSDMVSSYLSLYLKTNENSPASVFEVFKLKPKASAAKNV